MYFGKPMLCERLRSVVWMKIPAELDAGPRVGRGLYGFAEGIAVVEPRIDGYPEEGAAGENVIGITTGFQAAREIVFFVLGYSRRVASRMESALSDGSRFREACCQAPIWLKRLVVWT
jgi:hypothetical protein